MIDEDTKKFLRSVVYKYVDSSSVRAFLFGSRVTAASSKYSDIDLGLESKDPIPYSTIVDMEDDFENSNLPYSVDIVDFSKVSDKFKAVAESNKIYLQ